jgi:GNAT superfamily N-acetyltransferase
MEISTLQGPLKPPRYDWVAGLYGTSDARYRDQTFLEHMFARGPAGPALHAFAVDEGRPVGHCAVVPMWARRGPGRFRCGKLEALFVDPAHRGTPLVRTLLERLYGFAGDAELELLHAYVRPHVARVLGFEAVRAGERAFVAVTDASAFGFPGRVLAAAQALPQALSSGRGTLRPLEPEDRELVEPPRLRDSEWTIDPDDSWEWYRASPALRVLEVDGARALVQVPLQKGESLRLVGWSGAGRARRLLTAAAQLASESGAATLRFQPWDGTAGDGDMGRACRLLGFVRRDDFTTLYVRGRGAGEVVSTPLLYLGF